MAALPIFCRRARYWQVTIDWFSPPAKYFKRKGVTTFYPTVVVEFQIIIPDLHYHVPLLLSPFGYSTYRGS